MLDPHHAYEVLEPWTVFAIVFACILTLALIAKKLIWAKLRAWASRSDDTWHAEILLALNRPAKMIIAGLTLSFSQHFVPDTFHQQELTALVLRVYFLIIAIWVIDRVTRVVIDNHMYFSNLGAGTRQLLQFGTRLAIFSLGSLIVLDNLGISITPILASLGVGSVAVALALQDTLSNFFSGVYVLADRPISIGDYIRLEDNTDGRVTHIGWRSTRILLMSGNMMVIPNSKIASSRLTNYNHPNPETAFSVNVGVSYSSDLSRVEAIALDVAKQVMTKTKGAVAASAPSINFTSFDDSSIAMSVGLRAQTFVDIGFIRHEFIKALHDRFKKENIDIPFPQRVIYNKT